MKKQFIKRWFLMLRFTEFRALSIFKIGGNAMVTVTKIEFGVNHQIYFFFKIGGNAMVTVTKIEFGVNHQI